TARSLAPTRLVVVYGHGGDQVRATFTDEVAGGSAGPAIDWALQSPQLGTGHAVAQAVPFLSDDRPTLVLYGDVPLVDPQTLRRLADASRGGECVALLTETMEDPTGYGRIVREGGRVARIVEQKDA